MDAAQRKAALTQSFKALADGNPEMLLGLIDEQVQWTIIGNTKFFRHLQWQGRCD